MPSSTALSPSASTDLKLLEAVGTWQQIFVFVIVLSAAIGLCGCFVPPIASILPSGAMQPGNCFLTLLCGLSLFFTQPHRSLRSVILSRLLGFCVVIIASLMLADSFGFIAAQPLSAIRFASQTSNEAAAAFLLIGLVLTHLRIKRHLFSQAMDAMTLNISLLMLTFIGGYIVGATHVHSFATGQPFSPESFLSLCILTFVVSTRRAEYGLLSILFDNGIGGKTARFASPCAIILPFIFAMAKEIPVRLNLALESSVAAVSTSLLSVLAFSLVIGFARHTHKLEVATRELSLRDELTRLYNRRGFYVLGEQGIRLAQRAHQPFFVLFIDVDNLKVINDSMGHEIGSALLQEMADLLTSTFRELDVVARLGGDEFVVAGNAAVTDISAAITRLEAAAWQANAARMRPYHLSYSIGLSMSGTRCTESLDTLLERADKIMYDAKRARKQLGQQLPVLTMA
jgi:diguanylate cyclase (GGDEF)-like protein